MPAWDEVASELSSHPNGILDVERKHYIQELATTRKRNVICYFSGWMQKPASAETAITDMDMQGFMTNVHGMDRSKGLDLVLHTPGGDLAATEQLVGYLRSCFNGDVVAFIPQLAMSAGTMIACSCKEIYMGRQSAIGPTDPQFGGVAAGGVVEEFNHAVEQTQINPASIPMWQQIIGKYPPTYLGECQKAISVSQKMVADWLSTGMFKGDSDAENKAKKIADWLGNHSNSGMHNRHFSADEAISHGLKIIKLESDNNIQDIILTIYHTYMASLERSSAVKMIENSDGKAWIRVLPNP